MSTRRTFLKLAAAAGLAPSVVSAQGAAKVVVVGAGFAGATCARALKRLDPSLVVTLVEPNATYTACPFSNDVLSGRRELAQQQFGYDGIKRAGVVVAATSATAVDASAKSVSLADGAKLAYDRLVIAPGIDMNWTALPGYSEAAAEKMPAWRGRAAGRLARRQLEAMEDGGWW
jgi:NADH dehydrogenase FAD-containing subunit